MTTELQTLVQTDEPPIVFVSYSHKDEAWKDKLLPQLNNLGRLGILQIWDDRDIKAGVDWYAKIHDILSKTKVAICLISPDFLSSSFCLDEEVSYLLQRRNRGDLEIFPILLRDCVWDEHYWLKRLQMLPRDGKTILTHFNDDPDLVFADTARQVRDYLKSGKGWERPKPKGPAPKTDITRLPASDDILFGRRDELNFLDKTWKANRLNVAVLKASGGVGKSSLVRCWVEDMALDNYRGARRVYAWSFYSQGTNERVTSADFFFAEALEWFGDPSRGKGLSAWDQGQRLADLVRQQRTLLLLDGLEPLQSGHGHDRGKLKDSGLEVLLYELAKDNPGLCLITTREEVTDLWLEKGELSVEQYDLDKISAIAGRALLRVSGIAGEDDELEQTVRDFGQHAYAIKLLGSFLKQEGEPHIRRAAEIPDRPDIEEKHGKHPRRVMAAFAQHFGKNPKANILAMLGLFDRPADADCIGALRAAPTVTGLNDAVHRLSKQQWQNHIADLRLLGLLTPESHHDPDELDAHPLVREHCGAQLRDENQEAWQAGHRRLYEHLQTMPEKDQPDTLVEMAPLFQAVHHGCAAGRHQETYDKIYRARIRRENEHYLWRKLGAFGADLGVIASFFDSPWEQPAAGIVEAEQAWLLAMAAFNLRALGRLRDAVAPMRAGLDRHIEQESWANAARSAGSLSELHLTLGDVTDAVTMGEASVDHADRSGDDFMCEANRTTLADALIHRGDLKAAKALFEKAEVMQAKRQPTYPKLYSLRGYQYCDLLLTLGQAEAEEVRERALLFFKWRVPSDPILDIALDHLSLGRAALTLGEHDEARTQLDQAVDGLRKAGEIRYLPNGILVRAALFREMGEYETSRKDLAETMRIAKRGEMRLHQCDAHLEYTRLALAEGEPDTAREHLKSAEALVSACGYHRRDGEVEALKKELETTPS